MANELEDRQQKISLYNTVNDLYERVQQFCEGVYFEIVVQPHNPRSDLGRRFILNLVDFEEDGMGLRHVDVLEVDPRLRERLRKIERLQDNYKLLVDTAFDVFVQLKEEYKDRNCRVCVFRRQEEVHLSPRLQIDFDDDGEDQDLEADIEGLLMEGGGGEEEDDWLYSDDSGIDPETDVETNSFVESDRDDFESDVDSGLHSDTDSQSEMEIGSDAEQGWF